jgi:hypothetical protein
MNINNFVSSNEHMKQIHEAYEKLNIAKLIDEDNEDSKLQIQNIRTVEHKNIEQYWNWLDQIYKDIDHARNLDNQELFKINLNNNIWLSDALKRLIVINKITNINIDIKKYTNIQELIDSCSGETPHPK